MKQKHIKNDNNIIRDILEQVGTPEYDISDAVLKQLHSVPLIKNRYRKIIKPTRILAIAAAIVLIVGLINIQTVIAFVRGIFFVPGVGFTDNDIAVAMLTEPIDINTDMGMIILEFATKVKYDDDKCEILLYFSTTDEELLKEFSYQIVEERTGTVGTTAIDGEIHVFQSTGWGGSSIRGFRVGYFPMINYDFPDVNEFELQIMGATARVILTELNEEEKIPYTSKEINGITLAAYKFRGTNRILSLDVINKNDLGEFYTGTPGYIHFDSVTGAGGASIQSIGSSEHSFRGWSANDPYRKFSYYIIQLANEANTALAAINDLPAIMIEYFPETVDVNLDSFESRRVTTNPQLTLPIPKDGEILKTDIKIPVGGIIYEVSEVRRERDIIYFKDNSVENNFETFDMDHAIANNGIYIAQMQLQHMQGELSIDPNGNLITGFNPDDDYINLGIRYISVIYFGDFSIDLTQK